MDRNGSTQVLDDAWARLYQMLSELGVVGVEKSPPSSGLEYSITTYNGDRIEPPIQLTISRRDFDRYVRGGRARATRERSRAAVDDLWGDIDESLATDTDSGPPVRCIGLRRRWPLRPAYFEERR